MNVLKTLNIAFNRALPTIIIQSVRLQNHQKVF